MTLDVPARDLAPTVEVCGYVALRRANIVFGSVYLAALMGKCCFRGGQAEMNNVNFHSQYPGLPFLPAAEMVTWKGNMATHIKSDALTVIIFDAELRREAYSPFKSPNQMLVLTKNGGV